MERAANCAYTSTANLLCRKCLVLPALLAVCQEFWTHALAADEWWFTDLARRLNLPQPTLYSWLRRGWVHARQLPVAGGRWILWADAEEVDRLRQLHHCPRRWHNQPQAAALTQPKRRPESS